MMRLLPLLTAFLCAAAPLAAQNADSSDAAFSARLSRIEASPALRRAARELQAPKYDSFIFSEIISKSDLTKALQAMVSAAYGVGFRTLGNPDDFFHGHFIFDDQSPRPRFILWHTQERANLYHLYDPGSPLDYADKTKRNWITWLDNFKVETANRYRLDSPGPQWCAEEEAYTILPAMMDPAKLGFAPTTISKYYQFDFYRTECTGLEKLADSSVISVAMPDGRAVCLEFSTDPAKAYSKNFFKFARMLGEDQKRGKNLSRCR